MGADTDLMLASAMTQRLSALRQDSWPTSQVKHDLQALQAGWLTLTVPQEQVTQAKPSERQTSKDKQSQQKRSPKYSPTHYCCE